MAKTLKTLFEMAVANKVAEVRRDKGLSQDAIATMLEVTRGFIGQVESPNNPSCYSLDQINRLAYELECSIHDLLPAKPVVEPNWDK